MIDINLEFRLATTVNQNFDKSKINKFIVQYYWYIQAYGCCSDMIELKQWIINIKIIFIYVVQQM